MGVRRPALNGAVPQVLFAEPIGSIERVLVIGKTVFGGPKGAGGSTPTFRRRWSL